MPKPTSSHAKEHYYCCMSVLPYISKKKKTQNLKISFSLAKIEQNWILDALFGQKYELYLYEKLGS